MGQLIHTRNSLLQSDILDVLKTYDISIVKGEPIPKPGVPESFRVLVKELQAFIG